MRPQHPYAVRDTEALRQAMAKPLRAMPHSVRSLAERTHASSTTIGDLLTGKTSRLSLELAELLSETLEVPLSHLFVPATSASVDADEASVGGDESPEGVAP